MMNSGFLDFAVNIPKLEHFEGVGFRRWQKKMKFLLAALNVAYYEESSKDLWDVLEAKYISEDASSKKFLVSEFNEFRMVDNRSVMEQFHEIVRIFGQIRHHGMNMDDSVAIASIIDQLPPSWNKVHRALMQRKEELTMEQLGSHLYVEEGIRQKESKKKGGGRLIGASGSTINFVDEGKPYGNRKGKGKPGKTSKSSMFKKNGKGKGKTWVKCLVCNGPHFKKDCEVWKEKMGGISTGNHGQGTGQWKQGKIVNLVSDSTENFIAMISEVYVMQTDDSWWVDTGATRHVCKDINLYKIYKNLEDGPSLYMGNDSMV
nr:zinc finger, CCHC-type [Ipomoea batatas]